jgi:hypothetical protein
VQVGEQIINLLLCEYLFEAVHFVPAESNDVPYALVVGGDSALGQVLLFEHAF